MSSIIRKLKKIKRKYKRFKEDERGGDVVNNLFILVVTIIILAALILFAITLIADIKDGVVDLWEWPDAESPEGTSQYCSFEIKINSLLHDDFLVDFENLENEIIHPNEYLMRRTYINFLNIDKLPN